MNKPQDSKDNKDKLRVYEYAKSLSMSSKEIITILKRLDMPVNNHMSVMENEMVNKVEGFFRDIKANAAAKRAKESSGATVSSTSQAPSRPAQPKQQPVSQQEAIKPELEASALNNKKITQDRQEPMNSIKTTTQNNQQQRPSQSSPSSNNRSAAPSGSRPAQGSGQSQSSSRPSQGGQTQNSRPSQGGQSQNSRPSQGSGQGNRPSSGGPSRPPASQGANRPSGTGPSRPAGDASRSTSGNSNNKPGARKPGANQGQKRFEDGRPGGFGRNNNNNRGGRGRNQRNQPQVFREKIDNTPKKIIVRGTLTVGELAKLLHKDASEVIKKLIVLGVMATINQEIDMDAILLLAGEYGVEVEVKIPVEEDTFETVEETDEEADLLPRPPVVTIMGHVDHGKTTLLDAIRKTNVTGGEAGGITQHIGAYQIEANHKKITFLDTPGHEAFTLMRARGAQVTDITIIVVAADDGVMPQTVEAVNHAKAAGVPIIVAVNKIDKPDADADKIKQALTEYELVPEEWGGDTIFVNVSAKQRIGLEELLDMILLVAEVNDFKANPDKRARGTVIEAELDKGKGPVARVLVQHGTLKIGDAFVAGNCFGRIRAMVNDKGRRLKEAGPSTPVEITGLTEVPLAGDPFMVFEDERKARAIADRRAIKHRQSELGANSRVTLDDLYKHIKDGEIKDLNVIIKSDVQGSAEALKGSLAKIDIEGVRVKIIHSGVGAITESDINLASASNAIVVGFNVRPEPQADLAAQQEKVDVRMHRVIYNVIEEIEQAMKGMLDPIFKEVIIGHAEVRNVFKVSKVGAIAGSMITSGKITRSSEARIVRGGIVVFEGKIDTLKRFKDDVKEVAQGYECGITLERFSDFKEGDIIEAFVMESVER